MKAYTYRNTKTNIPNWEKTTHITQQYGYGYETDTHHVHFYGQKSYYIISTGLTVIEAKTKPFIDWIKHRFGAEDIEEIDLEVGHTVEGIWRPSLFVWNEIKNNLKIDQGEQHSQEQALRILVEKLDEILLFIEPSFDGLKAYSHKIRDLLILACTEVENQLRSLLNRANYNPLNRRMYTTQDYVKLNSVAYLDEYEIGLRNYSNFSPSKPFSNWDVSNPTKSLTWYNAYNETKHNRDQYFSSANLQAAIDAVAANIIIYCTRFSPFILINDTNTLSGLIKQIFNIKMVDSDRKSFYIPLLEFPSNTRTDCFVFDSYRNNHNKEWIIDPLII
ncbi:MAG: hypothetical protein JEY96_19620 [Bacteroidales bacterium]|nr:hypothetical protein [Bacteroidales bacterium]